MHTFKTTLFSASLACLGIYSTLATAGVYSAENSATRPSSVSSSGNIKKLMQGYVALSSATFSVSQTSGSLQVSVVRKGYSAATVQFQTSNGSAVAGVNYTGITETLSWASGDTSARTISIPISSSSQFSGTKSFTISLASPTGGAVLGTSSATATITGSASSGGGGGGSGGGSGGPSAVSSLQLTNQGGPSNAASPLGNYQAFSWTAATAGAYPVSYYKIYRNGSAYATSTSTSYADTNATNSNVINLSAPTTIYAYSVSAVDTQGTEGPITSASAYLFSGQAGSWGGCTQSNPCGDLNYSGVVTSYVDTTGSPVNGPYDMKVTYAYGGGFQPISSPPVSQGADGWGNDLEIGAFKYYVMDIKLTDSNYINARPLKMGIATRLPPGDVFSYATAGDVLSYATTSGCPAVGVWCRYKIPLSVLNVGTGSFTGSISGSTLTVTSVQSGIGPDSGGFITGPGVPAGTYIIGYNQNSSIGTFTIAGPGINSSTKISSTGMTFQRTGFYKSGFQWGADNSTVMYVNNLGFTPN